MRLSDFNYNLPRHLIAQNPVDPRDSSGLMILHENGIDHRIFHDLPEFLRPDDLLILNHSRVIPARLTGIKETGGKVEVLLVRQLEKKYYECLIKGRIKTGGSIQFDNIITAIVRQRVDSASGYRYNLKFECEGTLESHLLQIGFMPVPPYIKKPLSNSEQYQTVYSRHEGSIAAPTAGLHFTPQLLATIKAKGVRIVFITLHVGIGTFMPVRVEDIEDHIMESEYYVIDRSAANVINGTIDCNGRIIVVGTTTVRALESACWKKGHIQSSEGWSDIFIFPPYSFKTPINGLITNFHLPGSTLLMLVSAYAGKEIIMDAYQKAIAQRYRFYSFGDAMLIFNKQAKTHV
jgi:S-adenosylmethionine:tRNA ribosyltransferase-isomerase